jgi:hypothetical protein
VGSPGVNVSIGFGSGVGWFPLGPREVYVPGYWHSRRYIHNINITNTVIVDNRYITDAYRGHRDRLDYRYRGRVDAVTVVQRDSFIGGRPIGGHLTQVSPGDLRRWRHDSRPPAIAPDHRSVFAGSHSMPFGDRNERFARMDRQGDSRNRGLMPAGRVSFDTERRAIEANGNRPVTRSELFADPRDRSDFRGVRPSGGSGGWTSYSQPRSSFGPSGDQARRNPFDTNRSSTREWRDNGSRNRGNSGSAGDNSIAISPYNSNDSTRRNAWRTNQPDRSQRLENTPSRPSFGSIPRSSREDRSSQRFDRQRESRVQSMPAHESRSAPTPQQQAAPRASRGDGNRGGDHGGGRQRGPDRNASRQSQSQK